MAWEFHLDLRVTDRHKKKEMGEENAPVDFLGIDASLR
jgi:hypothetical protein